MSGHVLRGGADGHARVVHQQTNLGPLTDGIEVHPAVDERRRQLASATLERVRAQRHGSLRLVRLEQLHCLRHAEGVQKVPHEKRVVPVVRREVGVSRSTYSPRLRPASRRFLKSPRTLTTSWMRAWNVLEVGRRVRILVLVAGELVHVLLLDVESPAARRQRPPLLGATSLPSSPSSRWEGAPPRTRTRTRAFLVVLVVLVVVIIVLVSKARELVFLVLIVLVGEEVVALGGGLVHHAIEGILVGLLVVLVLVLVLVVLEVLGVAVFHLGIERLVLRQILIGAVVGGFLLLLALGLGLGGLLLLRLEPRLVFVGEARLGGGGLLGPLRGRRRGGRLLFPPAAAAAAAPRVTRFWEAKAWPRSRRACPWVPSLRAFADGCREARCVVRENVARFERRRLQ